MRILLVSDLHYALKQFDWVSGRAVDFDVVVIGGDLLSIASPVPASAQIVAVRTTLIHLARRVRVIVCSGNHDLNSLNEAGEKPADWLAPLRDNGVSVDGDSLTVGATAFTVLPWWDGPVARAGSKICSSAPLRRAEAAGSGCTTPRLRDC